MGVGNNQASIAAQVEAMQPELPLLALSSSVLWGKLESATDVTMQSSRPTRVATQVGMGGQFGTFFPDGADMGQGTGPQEVAGYIPSTFYLQASQYTALAEYATDSTQKAIQNYVTLTHKQAFESMGGYMDVQCGGNGSNTIDTIVAVGSGYLQVNNANFFLFNQTFDVWTAIGGTKVTTLQVQTPDVNNNFIWTTFAIPGTVTAGMVCTVFNSTGQANSGFFGLQYYNTNLNVGNYLSIPRASYPGIYTAQGINLNNAQLTPAAVRATQVLATLAMGDAYESGKAYAHCAPDQQSAWEANALTVQHINMPGGGNQSEDMLKPKMSNTIAGRPFLINPRGIPGRIDFIDFSNLAKVEIKPLDYYSVNGQTVFPVIGASGGLQSQSLFYVVYGGNMLMRNPRLSTYTVNGAIPKYIFGH